MKSALVALVVAALALVVAAPTRADVIPSPPPAAPVDKLKPAADATPVPLDDDPACIMKRPRALCSMPNGSGGVCVIATCNGKRPCLQCVTAPVNSPESGAYYLLIIVGALVTIGGGLLVMRLRRYWK